MWLILLAAIFTPSAKLHHSELDGAWQFGEAIERLAPNVEREVLLARDDLIELNDADSADYLVNNRFEWDFSSDGPTWLEFVYHAWSEETERGFDDPALVIFLGEELIFKKSAEEICCEERAERIYLGELSGEQRLRFFAGEMGDLEKPTTLKITELKVFVTAAETPSLTQEQRVAINTPLSPNFDPNQDSFTPRDSNEGEVLGASTEQRPVEESTGWRQVLHHFFNHPLAPIALWLSLLLVLVLFYLFVSLMSVLITTVKKRSNK